jgi:hypothetical protein
MRFLNEGQSDRAVRMLAGIVLVVAGWMLALNTLSVAFSRLVPSRSEPASSGGVRRTRCSGFRLRSRPPATVPTAIPSIITSDGSMTMALLNARYGPNFATSWSRYCGGPLSGVQLRLS